MADILASIAGRAKRLKDMGDGTIAEVFASVAGGAGTDLLIGVDGGFKRLTDMGDGTVAEVISIAGGGAAGPAAAGTLTGATLASNVVNSSLTSVGVLASPHFTAPVVDSGGLTFGFATSKIVPGATSFALRDNADTRNNLLLLDSGALTLTAQPGSGSGVAGSGHSIVTGAGGGGNAAGGNLALTLGAGTGTGRFGQLTIASSSAGAQTAMGDVHGLTHTFGTLTQAYGSGADQTRILCVTTETDTSVYGYPGILNAFIARVHVNTGTGSTIGKVEAVSGVINIKAGALGDLSAGGYATDGEYLHNSTQTITGTQRAVQGSMQVNSSGSFTTAYGGEFVCVTAAGQTGTFANLALGARGYVEHNHTGAIAAATGVSGEINLIAAGSITGATVGVQGWVHNTGNATYTGALYGGWNLVALTGGAVTSNVVYGAFAQLTFAGTAVGGSTNAALNAEVQNSAAATTTNALIGVNVRWRVNSAITQTLAIGLNVMAPNFSNTPTVTTGYGIRINDLSTTGAGTVTTSYALRIENQAAASANAYSLYVGGGRIQLSSTNGSALFNSTSQALTVSTTTSGTLAVTSAGLLTLTGVGASVWTPGDGSTIVLGTTTGTKIGTLGGAAGQKLGFFNATPIVQPLLATGGGATVDQVITLLQNLGLARQS